MSQKSVNTKLKTQQRASGRKGKTSRSAKVDTVRITPPLEWYRLTEDSRNVLNAVITTAAREERFEAGKIEPDSKKIENLKAIYLDAYNISRNSSNFESLDGMRSIVQRYNAVLNNLK